MKKLITKTYDVVTPESCEQGDTAENGFADFSGNRFPLRDEDGEHPENIHVDRALIAHEVESVDEAVMFLQDKCYVSEPSSSSFHHGVWYSAEAENDYSDGSNTTYSYHLDGFTEDEESAVFTGLFPGRVR